MGEQECARPGIRGTATPEDRAHPGGGGVVGRHGGEGVSRRDGRPEKNGAQAIGKSRGGWTTKIHMVAACTAIGFSLSPGQAGDAPEGRNLLSRLPERFGNWHTIYTRMSRWASKSVLDRVFVELQRRRIVRIRVEVASLDSTAVVHGHGTWHRGIRREDVGATIEEMEQESIPTRI